MGNCAASRDRTMQRGLVGIACAAFVSGVCFLALKRVVDAGLLLADVVLMATAATLVLAAAATGFALRALQRSRQSYSEIARLARSVDAAIRTTTASVDHRPVSLVDQGASIRGEPNEGAGKPTPTLARARAAAAQAKIVALASARPRQARGRNRHRKAADNQ
jgi:hypothetical protein